MLRLGGTTRGDREARKDGGGSLAGVEALGENAELPFRGFRGANLNGKRRWRLTGRYAKG